MLTLRIRLLNGLDRALAVAMIGLLLGASLAFGGSVWWGRPAIVGLSFAVAMAWLARAALAGPWRVLKSPLTAMGAMALALGLVQLVPLPAEVVGRLSPRSLAANATGVIPGRALADDPAAEIPAGLSVRTPLTLDRPATLRWLVGATACLAIFWVASSYSDRLGHARVIWGSVVAAFFVNAVLGTVQLANGSNGLYGHLTPGSGPAWAPTLDDALAAPTATLLRPVGLAVAGEPGADRPTLAAARPIRPFLVGSLMGGPGAFLALGSLALPLALGLLLQALSPRGSREGLLLRLRDSGQGSQVALMLGLIAAGSVLVGIMAGRWAIAPFAVGLALVGVLGTWSSGIRKTGLAITTLTLAAMAGGVAIGESSRELSASTGLPRVDGEGARRTWAESRPILRDFPVFGAGLGTFATVHPYYKARDAAPGTAMSSLAQWAVESGTVGLGLLATAGLWCLARLPGSIRRVGTADRPLAFGLLGSMACFGLFSAIHWTVELPAIALAAAAIAGTGNRWLAGGTDLFVDRG